MKPAPRLAHTELDDAPPSPPYIASRRPYATSKCSNSVAFEGLTSTRGRRRGSHPAGAAVLSDVTARVAGGASAVTAPSSTVAERIRRRRSPHGRAGARGAGGCTPPPGAGRESGQREMMHAVRADVVAGTSGEANNLVARHRTRVRPRAGAGRLHPSSRRTRRLPARPRALARHRGQRPRGGPRHPLAGGTRARGRPDALHGACSPAARGWRR